jgi:hypothetical protein
MNLFNSLENIALRISEPSLKTSHSSAPFCGLKSEKIDQIEFEGNNFK